MANSTGSRKSSGSSGSAKKSGGTAKKSQTAARSSSKTAKNAPKPIRREVGAAVCAFLAIFSFIGYFNVDGWFIDFFCGFIKGLLGWGFYLFPPALLLAAIGLAFHRGRPVAFRIFCCVMLPIIFGAMAHLLFSRTALELGGSFGELTKGLYAEGKLMQGGGLVAGLLSMALESMFSVYGAFPLLLALFLFFLMYSVNLSIGKVARWLSGRERVEYEYEPEPEPAPVSRKEAREAAKPTKKPKNRAIDIPVDDEPDEDVDYGGVKVSYFTEEEAVILKSAIESIDDSNLLKQNLKRKLCSVYDNKTLADTVVRGKNAPNIRRLIEAIEQERQAVLHGYLSAHGGGVRDRREEPFAFTTN